jgi:uncharacterized membrane protein YidH (DUF202 family)
MPFADRPPPADSPPADRPRFGTRDPGLAGERTVLAWERTGLSLAGIAALLATAALHSVAGLAVLPVSAALLGVAVAVRRAGGRAYAARDEGTAAHPPQQRRLRLLALCTTASALVAAIVVIAPLR